MKFASQVWIKYLMILYQSCEFSDGLDNNGLDLAKEITSNDWLDKRFQSGQWALQFIA